MECRPPLLGRWEHGSGRETPTCFYMQVIDPKAPARRVKKRPKWAFSFYINERSSWAIVRRMRFEKFDL